MKYFYVKHPIITFLVVAVICDTAIAITKIIKNENSNNNHEIEPVIDSYDSVES